MSGSRENKVIVKNSPIQVGLVSGPVACEEKRIRPDTKGAYGEAHNARMSSVTVAEPSISFLFPSTSNDTPASDGLDKSCWSSNRAVSNFSFCNADIMSDIYTAAKENI